MSGMINPQESLGTNLRRLREAKGYTLRRFAEALGVSATFISKLERDLPTVTASEENLLKMANLLEVSADELLALSRKVAKDVQDVILERPELMTTFLRQAKYMTEEQLRDYLGHSRYIGHPKNADKEDKPD